VISCRVHNGERQLSIELISSEVSKPLSRFREYTKSGVKQSIHPVAPVSMSSQSVLFVQVTVQMEFIAPWGSKVVERKEKWRVDGSPINVGFIILVLFGPKATHIRFQNFDCLSW